MSGVNTGSVGVGQPRPTVQDKRKEKLMMSGANTGSAGVDKKRPPQKRKK